MNLIVFLATLALAGLGAKPAFAQKSQDSKSDAREAIRLAHAKELLGRYYKGSVVRAGEQAVEIEKYIYQWTDNALKGKWKKHSKKVAQTVLAESDRYGFDPVLVMAVIKGESNFNPTAKGKFGEIGLMQLTPATAKWVSKKFSIPWKGKSTLRDPVMNIRYGAAYLSYLRERLDSHGRLYLAAYNMGVTNVLRALAKAIWPKDYPEHIMERYVAYYSDLSNAIEKEYLQTLIEGSLMED